MIEAWIVTGTLVLARVGTMVAVLPLFGGHRVPRMIKVGLAVSLATVWFGSFETVLPAALIAGQTLSGNWLASGLALGREAVLGALLGFGFGLFLLPAKITGAYIGQEMGLGLAGLADPTSDQSATVMSQIFEMLAVLLFLSLDGHHVLLAVLHSTFDRWPVGSLLTPLPVDNLVQGLNMAHEWGLVLAFPVAVCLFVTTLILAFLARAVPQLNLFTVGFALRLGAGLMAAIVMLPDLAAVMVSVLSHFGEFVQKLV